MKSEEMIPRSEALRDALGKQNESETDDQMMLSVRETCKRLGVSKWTIYRLMEAGKLASVKIGSRRLVPQRAMMEFIRQLEEEAGA